MSVVTQHFPQCDTCGQTNPDAWFDNCEDALTWQDGDWIVKEGVHTCPNCLFKEFKEFKKEKK